MPRKRPSEPIAPTTLPGEPTDPKIPPDDELAETDDERQARESEKAFDRAITRVSP